MDPLAMSAIPPMQNRIIPTDRLALFAFSVCLLFAAFYQPLLSLVRFASSNDLNSHILLIPFVSAYLAWLNRNTLPSSSSPNRLLGLIAFAFSGAVLICYRYVANADVAVNDQLTWQILAFVGCVLGVCLMCMGRATVKALAFPLGLLLFTVPLPSSAVAVIESFFQHTSATAAAVMFKFAGTPFFRDQTYFQLPGINLQVAPECSGIRSSIALFITSIVAGKLFLNSPYLRILFSLAVIPLSIFRNGVRIFTIGELCVHIGPHMIDSPIHHRGGPLFFAFSLIPFAILLLLLAKFERNKRAVNAAPAEPIAHAH